MRFRVSFLTSILLFLAGCGNGTGSVQLEGNTVQAGTWEVRDSVTGKVYKFTVTEELVTPSNTQSSVSYYKASGTVDKLVLIGFAILPDSVAPGGLRVYWFRNRSDGTVDGESNKVLRFENGEYVLAGDSASEVTETGRLKYIAK